MQAGSAIAMKPAALDRLLARLSILRRDDRAGRDVLRFEDLVLEYGTREVRRGARLVELTPMEFSLLELFLQNPGRVLTRHEILTCVWGFDFGSTSNALNVYIGYLRRKIEAGGEPRLVHTVRGVGYVLRKE
jgi:two-component system response regulator MprA